jgi:hypothetical protein
MNCVIQVVDADHWPHLPYHHYANVFSPKPKKEKRKKKKDPKAKNDMQRTLELNL